ncbi:MAG: exodeoxyribonuclease VII large subunit [Polyangiaceae bacterium]
MTSGRGAALYDILEVARRRGRVRFVLVTAPVQGADAAAALARSLRLCSKHPEVEVIVLARGGGSADDLAPFQEEVLVRAVAASPVPVVSAVGHEIDVTLVDLAADVRAATPSQAAELVVPDARARMALLNQHKKRLVRAMRQLMGARGQLLDEQRGALRVAVERALRRRADRVRELDRKLVARHPSQVLRAARARVEALSARVERAGRHAVEERARALGPLEERLVAAARALVSERGAELAQRAARLDAMSPLAVLGRGYAIVQRERDAAIVRRPADAAPGERVRLRLGDGELRAEILERSSEARPAAEGSVFGLAGHPVGHSVSRAMHLAAFEALGLPHDYRVFDVAERADFERLVGELRAGKLAGLNITLPHKRAALELADRVAESAAKVGAANVLTRLSSGGELEAHNTDVVALAGRIEGLLRGGPKPRGVALVLGAGGAALAAIAALRSAGFERVMVTSRSFTSRAAIEADPRSARLREACGDLAIWKDGCISPPKKTKLAVVVQASSAGTVGAQTEELLDKVPWDRAAPGALAIDVVYGPRETPFVERARAAGLAAESGLSMLVAQAEASFEIWLGVAAPPGVMRAAAERALAERAQRDS